MGDDSLLMSSPILLIAPETVLLLATKRRSGAPDAAGGRGMRPVQPTRRSRPDQKVSRSLFLKILPAPDMGMLSATCRLRGIS